MSDIEKEFFEAFGIEPIIGICDRQLNPENYSTGSNCGWEHPTDTECEDCTCYHNNLVFYPPITSDIVLGLEEIISKKNELSKKYIKYEHYSKDNNLGLPEMVWVFSVGTLSVINRNYKYSLLFLCTQLKPEISKEVKALFKC